MASLAVKARKEEKYQRQKEDYAVKARKEDKRHWQKEDLEQLILSEVERNPSLSHCLWLQHQNNLPMMQRFQTLPQEAKKARLQAFQETAEFIKEIRRKDPKQGATVSILGPLSDTPDDDLFIGMSEDQGLQMEWRSA